MKKLIKLAVSNNHKKIKSLRCRNKMNRIIKKKVAERALFIFGTDKRVYPVTLNLPKLKSPIRANHLINYQHNKQIRCIIELLESITLSKVKQIMVNPFLTIHGIQSLKLRGNQSHLLRNQPILLHKLMRGI